MVNRVETDGFLVMSSGADTVKVYCELVKFKLIKKGRGMHMEGGVNIFIPVFKSYVVLIAQGLWINSVAKIDNYLNYLKTWLSSGAFTVQLAYNDTPTYQKMDGVNTSFSMAPKNDFGNVEKVSKGNQTVYYVDKLILEEF